VDEKYACDSRARPEERTDSTVQVRPFRLVEIGGDGNTTLRSLRRLIADNYQLREGIRLSLDSGVSDLGTPSA
jgi:hypothetical protein